MSLLEVNGFHADILVNLLHFEILGLRSEVGAHHAVHAEHTVVWLVVVAEVAAVAPESFARLGVVAVDGLVNPVPDGAAHDEVGALDGIPVVDEVADGVTH